MRVVTIKHPPPAIEDTTADSPVVGAVYDLPPQLALLMIAAGWVRSETRRRLRRQGERRPPFNRRREPDRRTRRLITEDGRNRP